MNRSSVMCASVAVGCLLALGCQSNGDKPQPMPENADIADAPAPEIHFQTYIAAGDLAASRGQFGRAAEQYEKALQQQPGDAATLRKLAIGHAKIGQMPQSISAWQRYLAATNESAEAYGSLGYAYELAGNVAEAEKTYQAGIRMHPTGSLVHINYGLMLVRRNKVDEAVRQMSAVLQPHEVNYNIAGVYDQMGRKDLAQFYYRRALECNPGFSAARQKLSMVE